MLPPLLGPRPLLRNLRALLGYRPHYQLLLLQDTTVSNGFMRVGRATLLVLSSLVLIFLLAVPVPARLLMFAPKGRSASPDARVLVVTTNLAEAYGVSDVKDHRDMAIWCARIRATLDRPPDVLLLQEVRRSSLRWTIHRLSQVEGRHFRVVVWPSNPSRARPRTVVKTDTAIAINTSTMSAVDGGGFVRTVLSSADSKDRGTYVKRNAYSLVRQRSSGWTMPVVSVHLAPPGWLSAPKNSDDDRALRAQWFQHLASAIDDIYPNANGYSTFGGDFNDVWNSENLKSLSRGLGYKVDLRVTRNPAWQMADHLFTRSGGYEIGKIRGHFSDHFGVWMTIGPDNVAPTAPSNARATDNEPEHVRIEWDPATDNESSVTYYATRALDYVLRTVDTAAVDRYTYPGQHLSYVVVAVDAAHNISPPSNRTEVTVGPWPATSPTP